MHRIAIAGVLTGQQGGRLWTCLRIGSDLQRRRSRGPQAPECWRLGALDVLNGIFVFFVGFGMDCYVFRVEEARENSAWGKRKHADLDDFIRLCVNACTFRRRVSEAGG